ncbi:MAG TPA: hypothetical protein VEF35_01910 [Candidatus Bathyarchaeia archaeon]|nr:hypothetical protein [Candidatus Bathyarchaeia archaeon]
MLIAAAIILNGFLAGGNIDRALVQMPAWRKIGAQGWAAYSRYADLGNGLFLYPTLAIGGAVLTIAAAASFQFDITAPASAAVPIYLSVALVLGGLLATVKAAPIMMSLRRIGDEASALQKALDGFRRWGNVRGAFQILAFLANLWALLAVLAYV